MDTPSDRLTIYAELADQYDRLGQVSMRDRFLMLAADAALTAGRADEAERLRKYALIRQILADDAAIRDLANPRMANLSALFAGRPTRVLKELYGAR